ncbi:MAG: lipocalin family protein [Myxococcota bacterium]
MKLLSTVCAVLALALCVSACSNSTPVQDEPLPEAEQQDLQCTLLGKWKHTHIDGDPVEYADIAWTFRPDGTGVYDQTVRVTGQRGANPFTWRLEGRNIYLELEKGGRTAVYRADKWTDGQMKWFNYRLSDKYTVQRTEDAIGECP